MKQFAALIFFTLLFYSAQLTAQNNAQYVLRNVTPISSYISLNTETISHDPLVPVSLEKEKIYNLVVALNRENIPQENGPQFLKIITTITTRDGHLHDKIVQHAFTYPKNNDPKEDSLMLYAIGSEVTSFAFINRKKIDTVEIEFDSIPDWALVKIEIRPDEEFTKYAARVETKSEFYFLAKGKRFESNFFFGIPKVLYDSNKNDTITYGNASAMLRFYLLDKETGKRFPINLGIGTFGVSTPIDVSKNGGGFVLSLLFDVVELIRQMDIDLSSKFNAGVEVAPFFPLQKQARVLLNARIGYSP